VSVVELALRFFAMTLEDEEIASGVVLARYFLAMTLGIVSLRAAGEAVSQQNEEIASVVELDAPLLRNDIGG
jgi:small neutral amino acid transporter SnatA (MarC family)